MKERKPIQVSVRAWRIFYLESIRQTFKKSQSITMGDVLEQFANRLKKRHKFKVEILSSSDGGEQSK